MGSSANNPVMSTVAFLASVVDPKIAAAAAKAAIEQFSTMKDELPKEILDQHLKVVKQELKDSGKLDPNAGLKESDLAGAPGNYEEKNRKTSGENNSDKEKDVKKEKDDEMDTTDQAGSSEVKSKEPENTEKEDQNDTSKSPEKIVP